MSSWFRPKRYGYGATPCTWQGWLLTLAFVAVLAGIMTMLESSHSGRGGASYRACGRGRRDGAICLDLLEKDGRTLALALGPDREER